MNSSYDPLIKNPLLVIANEVTTSVWAWTELINEPVSTFHNCIVPLSFPEAKYPFLSRTNVCNLFDV